MAKLQTNLTFAMSDASPATLEPSRLSESSEPPQPPHSNAKLKILALHGYRQNGDTFKAKIGSFRKAVAKIANVTFLTAPHVVKPNSEDANENVDQRGWWFNAEDYTFSGTRIGGPAIGFTETLELLEKTFKDHGPFDGILGFSQGACLAGILAAMQQKGLLPYKFKFAIIASGFCSGSLVHKGFYDEEITLPTLHVFGETDKIIPKEMSETLAGVFSDAIIVDHDGGHYLACSGLIKFHYKKFLTDMGYNELNYYKVINSNSDIP
ncbi:esterase GA18864 isoform X2 [Arctopsyche grandis]|uniref:esterase GA18864 isoform X2 n=1 Tax=Arctopsyche grandis TaxID=121162 RepID=UPI00406D9E00